MSAPAKPASNWSKLKSKVSKPRTKQDDAEKVVEEFKAAKLSPKLKANYIGLDCEMVGIGPDGTQSALARCCLVDYDGEVIYDEFVRPPGYVTDFRTKWSGVRKKDLRQGTAISLLECQTAVANLLKDKVLVGHALRNDLDVLMLSHPRTMIRDTATFRPYMRVSFTIYFLHLVNQTNSMNISSFPIPSGFLLFSLSHSHSPSFTFSHPNCISFSPFIPPAGARQTR